MARPSGYAANMRGKERKSAEGVLATNLAKLVERNGGQSAFARHVGVPQKTVSRILSQENSARLDFLDKLYDKTKLEPWQILFPSFDPLSPPHAGDIGSSDARRVLTPDELDLLDRYRAADDKTRRLVDLALGNEDTQGGRAGGAKTKGKDAAPKIKKASGI